MIKDSSKKEKEVEEKKSADVIEEKKEKAEVKADAVKKEEKAVEPEVITTTSTTQPSTKPAGVLAGVVVMLLVLVAIGMGSAVLAAQQLGQNTIFSRFARVVPVETLPIVKNFVKSPTDLLGKAFAVESDINFQKSLNGREYNMAAKLDVSGKADNVEFTANGNIKQNMAFNGALDQFKYVTSVGGQLEAGAIGFNPGDEAFKVEVLQPNLKEMYLKFNLSPQMLKTMKAGMTPRRYPSSVESDEFKVEDYLDKYMKLDFKEYFKFIAEQSPEGSAAKMRDVDPEKLYTAYYELYGKLNADVMSEYEKTLGKWDRFSTATIQGREKVDQLTAIWIEAQVDSEKFADVSWEFVSAMPAVLKNHREDLLKYCEETSMFEDAKTKCEDVFGVEAFEKAEKDFNNNPDAKKKFEDGFKNFFKNVKFQKVRIAINPVDNSILKVEVELTMDKEGFQKIMRSMDAREREIENFPLEKLTISINSAEVKRGHNFSVQAPADSMNLVEKMRDYVEAEKRKRRQQQEEYQRMMENYQKTTPRRPTTPTPYVY